MDLSTTDLSTTEVAADLGVSPKTIRNWCDQGLMTFRLGGGKRPHYIIFNETVKRFKANHAKTIGLARSRGKSHWGVGHAVPMVASKDTPMVAAFKRTTKPLPLPARTNTVPTMQEQLDSLKGQVRKLFAMDATWESTHKTDRDDIDNAYRIISDHSTKMEALNSRIVGHRYSISDNRVAIEGLTQKPTGPLSTALRFLLDLVPAAW